MKHGIYYGKYIMTFYAEKNGYFERKDETILSWLEK